MGTGQQHTQGTAHLRGPWSHTPVIGPGQALDVGTRGVFPLSCERSEQWRETITASSPSTLRAGLNGRVWHRWKRSCTADAAPCRPIAHSHPPGCTETMAPPAFPSWAKPTSEVPGAPPFLSLFQHTVHSMSRPETLAQSRQRGCGKVTATAPLPEQVGGHESPRLVRSPPRHLHTPKVLHLLYSTIKSSPGAPRPHPQSSEVGKGELLGIALRRWHGASLPARLLPALQSGARHPKNLHPTPCSPPPLPKGLQHGQGCCEPGRHGMRTPHPASTPKHAAGLPAAP